MKLSVIYIIGQILKPLLGVKLVTGSEVTYFQIDVERKRRRH